MWQPTASFANLQKRALLLTKIREFFAKRNIMEVETPLLSRGSTIDPHIISLTTQYHALTSKPQSFYLQTSPEFAMKRLLAAGSGAIYQICKAFRDDESGRYHNPEFTMLEWYQPNFDHQQLMNEMDEFLRYVIAAKQAERVSYRDVFRIHLDIDPFTATIAELQACATLHSIESDLGNVDKDTWLHLILSHLIEPKLGIQQPTFIFDYPASQSALAKVRKDEYPVAERFEVYINGIELANGFHELTNASEQRKRFMDENATRKTIGIPEVTIDENFLTALQHGLPNCAGVALGVDRLLMIATGSASLSEVITFPIDRA